MLVAIFFVSFIVLNCVLIAHHIKDIRSINRQIAAAEELEKILRNRLERQRVRIEDDAP